MRIANNKPASNHPHLFFHANWAIILKQKLKAAVVKHNRPLTNMGALRHTKKPSNSRVTKEEKEMAIDALRLYRSQVVLQSESTNKQQRQPSDMGPEELRKSLKRNKLNANAVWEFLDQATAEIEGSTIVKDRFKASLLKNGPYIPNHGYETRLVVRMRDALLA